VCDGAGKQEFLEEACWGFNAIKIHGLPAYLQQRWGCSSIITYTTTHCWCLVVYLLDMLTLQVPARRQPGYAR
jgi:hypothetical protein